MINKITSIVSLIARGQWKHAYYKISNKLIGIDTAYTSLDALGLSERTSNWYVDSGGPDLEIALKSLSINDSDSILDFGCGKGGAIMTLSKYPFRYVDGVDISEELLSVASKNIKKRRCSKTQLFRANATKFLSYDMISITTSTCLTHFHAMPCMR